FIIAEGEVVVVVTKCPVTQVAALSIGTADVHESHSFRMRQEPKVYASLVQELVGEPFCWPIILAYRFHRGPVTPFVYFQSLNRDRLPGRLVLEIIVIHGIFLLYF